MATPKKSNAKTNDEVALVPVDPDEVEADFYETGEIAVPEDWPELDEAAFVGPIGEAVLGYKENTEADPAAMLASIIAQSGIAMGRGPHFNWSGQEYHGNLFALLVGPTSRGRKGTAGHDADTLMSGCDDIQQVSGFGSGESIVTSLVAPHGTDNTADSDDAEGATLNSDPLSFLIHEEEFARLLGAAGRAGSTLSEAVRQLFDGVPLSHRTVGSGLLVLKDYHAGVIGHITPEELRSSLSAEDRVNGLANRFLMIGSHSRQLVCFASPGGQKFKAEPEKHIAALAKCTSKARNRQRIGVGSVAALRLRDIYMDGLLESRSPLLSRLFTHLCRVALILAAMDCSKLIKVAHVDAAFALVTYAKDTTEFVFPFGSSSPLPTKILKAITATDTGALSQTELSKAFNNHLGANERDEAIKLLVEYKRVTVDQAGKGVIYRLAS